MSGKRKLAVTASSNSASTDVSRYDNRSVSAHVRGWDEGVKVLAYIGENGAIVFDIWTTGGSNDSDAILYVCSVTRGSAHFA